MERGYRGLLTALIESIGAYLRCGGHEDPVTWALEHIDFSLDTSSAYRKLNLRRSPFLRDPIAAWDFRGVKREVTVVAPEQTGKTLCWLVGLVWTMIHEPCLSMVVYKSDEYAERINAGKMKPLLMKIPSLAAELARPRSNRKDHYNFSDLKSYFSGSGTRISSLSARICIADELDDWQEHEGYASNLDDLRKRQRSFDDSILYKVCSPRSGGDLTASQIWTEFETSSRGYWHLQCLKCKGHTMRSCDVKHLQFDSDDYRVKPGSCRLVCPECGYRHTEEKHPKMTLMGAYIHEVPELLNTHPGFQWGALAVAEVQAFSWDAIAQAQLDAGNSGSLAKQILFDNSFRGLPFKARRNRERKLHNKLMSHQAPLPDAKDIVLRLFSADTQDDGWFYVVRGYDANWNSYLLRNGQAPTQAAVVAAWDGQYLGGQCDMGIIDHGGHRAREVGEIISGRPGLWAYKGRSQLANKRWERSGGKTEHLILANPWIYQAELLYAMYSAEKGEKHQWYIPETVDDEYITQMQAMHPDNGKRDGHLYSNWKSDSADHYFDCEKMMVLLLEVARHFRARMRK